MPRVYAGAVWHGDFKVQKVIRTPAEHSSAIKCILFFFVEMHELIGYLLSDTYKG